jgi:peptide/nickel transport system substrate-binding protein
MVMALGGNDRTAGRGVVAALTMAALLFTSSACATSDRDETEGPERSVTTVAGGTLAVGGAGDVAGFNVGVPRHNVGMQPQLMMRVWPSPALRSPDGVLHWNRELVESVEMTSTNPQTVVYRLNPRATWSDGVPISAEDFIYNYQIRRPGATDVDGTPAEALRFTDIPDPVESITGSDGGKTVTLVYKRPYRLWQAMFWGAQALIPAHVARRVGWNHGFDRFDPSVVISGGPFRVASHNPGKDLTLVRNEKYWGPPATLDSIVYRIVSDPIPALENGEVDLVLREATADDVERVRRIPGLRTEVYSGQNQQQIGFNLRNELLAIPEVRRAIALAIDRPAIAARFRGVSEDVELANNHFFARGQRWYRDTSGGRYDRPDVTGAKALLEGAGFRPGPDGVYARGDQRLSVRISTASTDPTRLLIQELVQDQLKRAGIEVRPENTPFPGITTELAKGNFDLEIFSYGKRADGAVPQQFRQGGGYWGYSNSRVNQLVAQVAEELDETRQTQLLEEADRIIWEDMPSLPLFHQPMLVAVRDSFVGVGANQAGGLFWNAQSWARTGRR